MAKKTRRRQTFVSEIRFVSVPHKLLISRIITMEGPRTRDATTIVTIIEFYRINLDLETRISIEKNESDCSLLHYSKNQHLQRL